MGDRCRHGAARLAALEPGAADSQGGKLTGQADSVFRRDFGLRTRARITWPRAYAYEGQRGRAQRFLMPLLMLLFSSCGMRNIHVIFLAAPRA
jgi:hypothetical protein